MKTLLPLIPFMGQSSKIKGTSLCSSFNKLVESIYIPYNGSLIERTATGFVVFGQEVKDLPTAKGIIDGKKGWLGNNLMNKFNNGDE